MTKDIPPNCLAAGNPIQPASCVNFDDRSEAAPDGTKTALAQVKARSWANDRLQAVFSVYIALTQPPREGGMRLVFLGGVPGEGLKPKEPKSLSAGGPVRILRE